MANLRLDEDFLKDSLKSNILEEYLQKFRSRTLEDRVQLLLNTYGI